MIPDFAGLLNKYIPRPLRIKESKTFSGNDEANKGPTSARLLTTMKTCPSPLYWRSMVPADCNYCSRVELLPSSAEGFTMREQSLNADRREAYNRIKRSYEMISFKGYLINGPAGTGKTRKRKSREKRRENRRVQKETKLLHKNAPIFFHPTPPRAKSRELF